ncbi:MFS transporter [Methanoculleus sp. Wushi-C6]|uniref:MFS transporter n=2 Tax=Methanoculleus caldifontis TaxID=2651577 RepID=A0ABU3X1S2_9EURY|nr:MFS transporter [Methanoculleus sp. Wushi-C6]
MGTAAMSSISIALPLIMQEFDSTLGVVSWVLNGYMLVLAGFCVIIGRLADTRGLKRTFLEGILLFSIASLLCFLAWDILALIVARVLQALGAAMFIASGPALMKSGSDATILFAAALTVPALICSYLARDRRDEARDPGPVPADDRACDPGF